MSRGRLRRLFRINLRGVLVVVAVLCVLLAFKVRQVNRQKAAVEWVEEMGGTAIHGYVSTTPPLE